MRILLLTLLVSACAAPAPSYDDQLRAWVGFSAESLYDAWGVPNNQFYIDGNTTEVTYVKLDNGPVGGNTQPYASQMYYPAMATPSFPGPNPDQLNTYYCKISFVIQNNVVTSYSYNGDDCVGRIMVNN